MTPTPRTDGAVMTARYADPDEEIVKATFAERLESELIASNRLNAQLAEAGSELYSMAITLCRERGWSKHSSIDKWASVWQHLPSP